MKLLSTWEVISIEWEVTNKGWKFFEFLKNKNAKKQRANNYLCGNKTGEKMN